MKAFTKSALIPGFLLAVISITSSSHALGFSDKFTCEAKDLFTGHMEIKTGSTQEEACDNARAECIAKTGNEACVATRWYDDETTADGMTSGDGWACEVTENNGTLGGRSWVRPGATILEARTNAMTYCTQNKAGNNCQIVKCFDASNEQPNP